MADKSSIKSQILTAIGSTDDAAMKTVLLLMLQVLEEIGGKIDFVLADEATLRDAVLNGHALQHDADHDWIRAQREKEAENAISGRKIRDGIIEKIIWAAFSAGFVWMMMK